MMEYILTGNLQIQQPVLLKGKGCSNGMKLPVFYDVSRLTPVFEFQDTILNACRSYGHISKIYRMTSKTFD